MELHRCLTRARNLKNADRPVTVEAHLRVGQIMDNEQIPSPGERYQSFEEGEIRFDRHRIPREVQQDERSPLQHLRRNGVQIRQEAVLRLKG
ncbi:hypothetical protein D3C75_1126510 [compost metagenome]